MNVNLSEALSPRSVSVYILQLQIAGRECHPSPSLVIARFSQVLKTRYPGTAASRTIVVASVQAVQCTCVQLAKLLTC
eukprot:SAG11_NODE_1652_length_4509_cov_3.121088_6_plen_78_part_00